MALTYIQIPTDGTGKKVRTQTVVDGADTVHIHYFIPCDSSGVEGLALKAATTTASSPTFATVGVASASAVAANANRKGLILVNTSANTISLNMAGGAAVLNSGVTLFPGQAFVMDDRSFTTSAIFAIASAGSSNLGIQELV